ncbi:uncharacterized protein [Venturia canescens]|uniref:uncharacterized protein n=1 Tax=Venturia canescens TaxID=32260 RepID=UPI001C9CBF83|nr:uncharacterized protein LOC122418552 [Venturia canescens]
MNQPSTSANLKPDPQHGGFARFQDVNVTELFRKDTQAVREKLQNPAIRAMCRLQSAAGITSLHKPDGTLVMFKDWDAINGYKKKFWIKFLCQNNQLKIDKYYMPPGFDRKELETEYTIGSLNNKQFLNKCKTWVECFTYRKQQFKKLEDFLKSLDLYCAIPHANSSYKIFSIQLERHVKNRFVEAALIVVKICYSQNITKPTKLVIESATTLELADRDQENLQNLFKILKIIDVEEALEQIFNSPESKGIWKRQEPFLEDGENGRSRESDESFDPDDSSPRSKRLNEETLESHGKKRSRLSADYRDSSDQETQKKKAPTRRKRQDPKNLESSKEPEPRSRNSPQQKKNPAKASSSNQKNKSSKTQQQKSSGAKKNSRANVPAKKKR